MTEEVVAQKRAHTYEQTNHVIILYMTKEIAMVQRFNKGKHWPTIRHILKIEKEWNSPVKLRDQALKLANTILELGNTINSSGTNSLEN